jgi:hypothetical protein
MMRWFGTSLLMWCVAVTAACERPRTPEKGFSFEDSVTRGRVVVLRADTSRTAQGFRVAHVQVFLVDQVTTAGARATLQHVIDSIAAADTGVAGIRVRGFVIGDVRPGTGSADLVPAIDAVWGPIDTVGITGAVRRSRFRTDFTILRPFPPALGTAPTQ